MKLQFEQVRKRYGKQVALDNFDVTLSEGVYGLLGHNGAGKTTLINILIGILDATEGRVLLDGVDVKQMGTTYLDRIGYLPQYPLFYKNFYIDEFLKYMCALKGIPKSQVSSRIEEVLTLVNLTSARKKKISALSGGMRQRVGIAQAILNRPDILVLDEPTAGLDPGERIRFRNIISKLSKDKLVLLATHIVSDVEYIAKEILMLDQGKLVMQGSPEQLAQGIKGKVWEMIVHEEEIEATIEKYQVRNVKRLEEGFSLRIVSDDTPPERCREVEPSLEDVFLSMFEK